MDKQEIRSLMRQRAAAFLASGQAEAETRRLLGALEALPAWQDARCVLLYMALPDEVPTSPLLERWHGRKRLVLPRVVGSELELREYRPGCLQEGYRGILEPSISTPLVDPSEIDLAVIPGMAFAPKWREGHIDDSMIGGRSPQTPCVASLPSHPNNVGYSRLGRGKGYYDRFLPRLKCPTVGLCYPFRLLETLPSDPWDRPLDSLVY